MSETVPAGLTLAALHRANIDRQAAWCPDQAPDLSFRGNELAGETGEACNVIKKLERERQGWAGSRDTIEHLAEELADVVICADLCAVTAGVDLQAAVVAKWNATSEKVGLPHRLEAAPALPTAEADELRAALIVKLDEFCEDYKGSISIGAAHLRRRFWPLLADIRAALSATPETASLHEPSIVEGGIKLPSNSPETAKPDTSAADREAFIDLLRGEMGAVLDETEDGSAFEDDPNFEDRVEGVVRAVLPFTRYADGPVPAALHPAPATASSGGMAEAAAVLADLKAGVFYNIDGSPRRVLDRLQLPDRAASTIEALSKQVADYARDAYQCGQRLADMEARAEAAEAALAEQSRRADEAGKDDWWRSRIRREGESYEDAALRVHASPVYAGSWEDARIAVMDAEAFAARAARGDDANG
ncbi:MazG-like family protein [Aureimonas psammosilenae]|uniref:MazG-like family protein n=1 Tax=Aureimonas psammosilenae TaxID=2495496 RepID=UPI0012611ACA|nr:MazG-like family protein [Aureimonas psammosilenae]